MTLRGMSPSAETLMSYVMSVKMSMEHRRAQKLRRKTHDVRKAHTRTGRQTNTSTNNQRQKKSLVRLRSSSCEATVWTEAGIDLRNTAP